MLVYVTNCRVGGWVGGGGEIFIPRSEALRAADKNVTQKIYILIS
jgi:hypothetical protein